MGAVGQLLIEVPQVVAQADDNAKDHCDHRFDHRSHSTGHLEAVDHTGYDGLQHRHGAGNRGKEHHGEEQRADDVSGLAHGHEDLRQRNKHQRGAAGHTFFSAEYDDRGDDHDAGQEGNDGIEELNLVNGFNQVGVIRHIGAVSDHYTHGHAEGVEELSQSVHDDIEELPHGQSVEIGDQVDLHALQTGGHLACIVFMLQGKGKDRNADNQNKKDRHDDPRGFLNTAADAHINDDGADQQEDIEIENRLENKGRGFLKGCVRRGMSGDEIAEVTVFSRCSAVTGSKGNKVFQYPSADHAVIRHDQEGNDVSNPSDPTPALFHFSIGGKGTLLGKTADGNLGCQQGKAKGECQSNVHDQEKSTAVLGCQIGKTPDVSQADSASRRGENKTDRSLKGTS